MRVESVTVGVFASNCHFLIADDHRTLVVDPGGEPERLIDQVERLGLKPVAYLLTHGHVDHVSALKALYDRYPAPVGLHAADAAWAFSPRNAFPPYYEQPLAPACIERSWAEGQLWEDAGFPYSVLETPGHSPGGVCFYFKDHKLLVAGDTLFAGSVGRTNLEGGDSRALAASLQRLAGLSPDTRILCGHGDPTRMDRELRTNPYMRGLGQ